MPNSNEFFDEVGWDNATDYISRFIELEPKRLKALQSFVKNQSEKMRCRSQVLSLYSKVGWNKFAQGVILELSNPVDQPFVRLMLSLTREKFNYNPMQMHLWWRRLKATDQRHIITYFNLTKFCNDFPDRNTFITWVNIVDNCSITQDILNKVMEGMKSNRDVELNLRSRLGVSMTADLREAWKKWAKNNHPDKGGDLETFVITKACYEEWDAINSKQTSKGDNNGTDEKPL